MFWKLVTFIIVIVITPICMSLSMSQGTPIPSPIQLSFRENIYTKVTSSSLTKDLPNVVFIHGLDSSSHTWRDILVQVEEFTKAIAFDMRGCGTSPLADADEFSPDNIVQDIHYSLLQHPEFCNSGNIHPFVIVGHSMGARIAMSFALTYPALIKALVVEDMDIRQRPLSMNVFRNPDRNRGDIISFNRDLKVSCEEKVKDIFEREGYPRELVSKWLKEGRVHINDKRDDNTVSSYYYSEVNPAFRLLCYEQFFIPNHGEEVFTKLAKQEENYPIHVFVADREMTVCSEESLWEMKKIMNENSRFMAIHRYPGATHSIHNSANELFLKDLHTILKTSSLQ